MSLDPGHQIFTALAEVLCIPGREDVAVTCRFSSPGIYEVRFVRHGRAFSVWSPISRIAAHPAPVSMLAHEYNEAILRLTPEGP
jgi:hypothetical protein